jgi:2-hydroxychromene-2-carboxylate isomerase
MIYNLLDVQLAMHASQPTLYFDLGSPYAYLAAERAPRVLGVEPRFEPVLVGGIFVERGHGSWAHTAMRAQRIAEVEARAERYDLPPLSWPPGWPNNTLTAMRAATWADRLDSGRDFAVAAFRRAFQDGADLSLLDELAAVAASIGLPAKEMTTAIASREIKAALHASTERAWQRGVVGVPCLEVNGEVFYGDDRLEVAAHRLEAETGPRE